jgi:hypothetical protein
MYKLIIDRLIPLLTVAIINCGEHVAVGRLADLVAVLSPSVVTNIGEGLRTP